MTEDQVRVDSLYRHRKFKNNKTGETLEQEQHNNLPEELMNKLQEYYGDGEGRVSVGGTLGSSVQFHKCDAFVNISVSCDNDLDVAEKVHNILQSKVGELVAADLVEMSKLRDSWLAPADRLHGKTKSPPKKGPTSLPPAKGLRREPPKRTTSTKKGTKRLSFKR